MIFRTATAVALALGAIACSTRPSAVPVPGPVLLSVALVQIDGPDSVPFHATVQFSATAVLSDGTTRSVTDSVTWESSNAALMTVSPRGLVTTGDQRGEGEIRARYDGLPPTVNGKTWGSRKLFVLPAGTYALSGSVKDGGVPLSGVEIELTDGLGTRMAATANPLFQFYGVAGDTEIRASKAGYNTETRRVLLTAHQTLDFDLIPSSARPIVSGTYTLKLVAAAECRDRLPENARARTYTAVVAQTGAQLQVVLSGANLGSAYGASNSFAGSVEPSRALFVLDPYFGNTVGTFVPPSILELLAPPGLYVTFFGSVVTTANENGYSGTLDGSVEVLTPLGGPWDLGDAYARMALCRSTGHQFLLVR